MERNTGQASKEITRLEHQIKTLEKDLMAGALTLPLQAVLRLKDDLELARRKLRKELKK